MRDKRELALLIAYIDEYAVVRQLTGASAGEYYYLLKELCSVANLAQANGRKIPIGKCSES